MKITSETEEKSTFLDKNIFITALQNGITSFEPSSPAGYKGD